MFWQMISNSMEFTAQGDFGKRQAAQILPGWELPKSVPTSEWWSRSRAMHWGL